MNAENPPEQNPYAEWNQGLEAIEPLIEYYSRQMGQLSGRLMTALSFLTDLEDAHDWRSHTAEVQEAVHYSRLLIASVLRMVAAVQEAEESEDELDATEAIREALKHLSNGKKGGRHQDKK